MSWKLLERFIESEHFNNDPSLAVGYLSRYSNHVGIQYVLCGKLRKFAYEEIEFFLPQLCHLLVSVENESMALEDFIIDLCQESVSGALLTFWLFQTHLHDLSGDPSSPSFRTCRRIFNKVQNIVFGATDPPQQEKIRENVLPTTVLASIILAGVAAPFLPRELGPLAVAQARKPRPPEDTISDAPTVQPAAKLSRSHTISGSETRSQKNSQHSRTGSNASAGARTGERQPKRSPKRRRGSLRSVRPPPIPTSRQPYLRTGIERHSSVSLPDYSSALTLPVPPRSAPRTVDVVPGLARRHSGDGNDRALASMTREAKARLLRSNYFRSETQFLAGLEGISTRLVSVPKPARLSALRAELALIALDLPAEVDIPLIYPATLEDGIPSRSKHHRIVRINPAEATSLNSAERVPYLLLVEILREDFDFNPDSVANQRILSSLLSEKNTPSRRLFDISSATLNSAEANGANIDSVFEPATGDLSSPTLLKSFSDDPTPLSVTSVPNGVIAPFRPPFGRSSSGANTISTYSQLSTPRTSDVPSTRSPSPGLRRFMANGGQAADQHDFSALATHMRTAAQMLAQLDISGSKRPRHEVEAIKAKIIASMQSLEEQNFSDDAPPTTFDGIMSEVAQSPTELEDTDPGLSSGAGAARMENDQKTAGVRRKGDRDDPSAAMFGEEWRTKRERIRKSSPYGYMKNWDLLSVIVKTGSDLRQEMFATQLIRICSKIWEDAGIPVWVKQMKILVTGESSGLIETITNGVSLHSLKRSLTLGSIAAGTNPRKRIATLKDHFVRTFGDVDSPAYRSASDGFMRSLAAYSIICYVLQLKDRHNGNILIDNHGHIIHIDFGFMLSNSPGSVGFEAAPFKFTQEYVDVLGGLTSPDYDGFKSLCKQAFQALRKNAESIVSVVEMMGKDSKMACFASGGAAYAISALRQRFALQMGREEAEGLVEDLITKSLGSYYTRLYDTFQYRTQGIY